MKRIIIENKQYKSWFHTHEILWKNNTPGLFQQNQEKEQ